MAVGVSATSAASVVGTARDDSYSVMTGDVLDVPAPGVLANDTVIAGSATAELQEDVDHGSLDLDEDGGFRYEPASGFVGTDSFTYRIPGGLLLLLPSEPATVTITVTALPTPEPTPEPTPTPTLAIDPVLTLLPSIDPLPTLSLAPLPSIQPIATPTPTPAPTATPVAGRSPDAQAGSISSQPRGGSGSSGGSGSPTGDPTAADTAQFWVPSASTTGDLDLDIDSAFALRGFDWAIPALVLTVPGILLILAVLAQALFGILSLRVSRRWLRGDRRRRAQPAPVSTT